MSPTWFGSRGHTNFRALSDVNGGTTSSKAEREVGGKGGTWEAGLRFLPGTVYYRPASTKRHGYISVYYRAKEDPEDFLGRIAIYIRFKNRQN